MNDEVARLVPNPIAVEISLMSRVARQPGALRVLPIDGHKVFDPGQNEDVGLIRIAVERQHLLSLPGDRRDGEAPTEPEGTIAGPGVVFQQELRAGLRTTETRGNRYGQCARAGYRVGGELLTEASDCAAAL